MNNNQHNHQNAAAPRAMHEGTSATIEAIRGQNIPDDHQLQQMVAAFLGGAYQPTELERERYKAITAQIQTLVGYAFANDDAGFNYLIVVGASLDEAVTTNDVRFAQELLKYHLTATIGAGLIRRWPGLRDDVVDPMTVQCLISGAPFRIQAH